MSLLGTMRRWCFGISAREVSFERRGFRGGGGGMREHLERVGQAFAAGYHATLENDQPAVLGARLNQLEADTRGFAFEGAAMGLALRDYLTPWRRNRVQQFLAGPGDPHAYMVHVGVGWTLARIPGRLDRHLARLDPLLRWLAVDGYGFHEGFFRWPQYLLQARPAPKRLTGYARRAFDQGLGRCLWFIDGGDVNRIPETIAALPPERHPDLWSGVGLAAVYAGGAGPEPLERLRAAAGIHQACLAQGAAFAAKARLRAGNPNDNTETACQALCGMTAEAAALLTDTTLKGLPPDDAAPAFELWRGRIQEHFQKPTA